MFCAKCNIEVPSSYIKCPSCGTGFNGASSDSSFKEAPIEAENNPTQKQPPKFVNQTNYDRIGGWLILPSIGLVISFFTLSFGTYELIKPYFEPGLLNLLTNPSSQYYIPYFMPAFAFEIILNVVLVAVVAKAIYLLSQRSIKAPKLIIFFYVLHFLGLLADLILTTSIAPQLNDKEAANDVAKAFGVMLVWGLYFYKSERVKRTFVLP
jgi:hypothetical protein